MLRLEKGGKRREKWDFCCLASKRGEIEQRNWITFGQHFGFLQFGRRYRETHFKKLQQQTLIFKCFELITLLPICLCSYSFLFFSFLFSFWFPNTNERSIFFFFFSLLFSYSFLFLSFSLVCNQTKRNWMLDNLESQIQ